MVKYPWSRREPPPPEPRRGLRGFLERHVPGASVALMVVLLLGFVLYPYMVVTVPSGQVGVLWKRFSGPGIYCWCILSRGTVLDPVEIRNEGLHLLWPWDKLFFYDLRLQSTTDKYNAITKDGVSVTAEINIRYQLNHDSAAVLHKFIGPGFVKVLLSPEIGSQTREVISHFSAEQVYVSRQEIEDKIKKQAQETLGAHLNILFQAHASEQDSPDQWKNLLDSSIRIIDTPVLSMELPKEIVGAINSKTQQYYMIQEYRFRAEREAEESKRKQIEANGIAAFQRTASQGISDSYLRWRGIEATLALAQSSNTKIVIIGSGKDGLPIILGNVDNPPVSNPGPKPTDGGTSSTGSAPADLSTPSGKSPPDAAAKSDKQSSPSFDLSDLEAIISRLSDALRKPGSETSSGKGADPSGKGADLSGKGVDPSGKAVDSK